MAERPDSPLANQPELPEEQEQIPHHISQRKKRKRRMGDEEMELQMTSMIDVIFLLLIYFVITANFMIHEGAILAKLPGETSTKEIQPLDPPLVITVQHTGSPTIYNLKMGRSFPYQPVDGASDLYAKLKGQIDSGTLKKDDIVQIKPTPNVRWQHVVNVYNACIRNELTQVGFAAN